MKTQERNIPQCGKYFNFIKLNVRRMTNLGPKRILKILSGEKKRFAKICAN